MKLADLPQLANASVQDKMELVNDLLLSMGYLPYEDELMDDELSDEIKGELDRRWAEYEKNPEIGLTLEEVERRLEEKYG